MNFIKVFDCPTQRNWFIAMDDIANYCYDEKHNVTLINEVFEVQGDKTRELSAIVKALGGNIQHL